LGKRRKKMMRESINVYTIGAASGFVKRKKERSLPTAGKSL